ncbi:Type I Iterative PKS [Claviceps pusilla]|uniref:Type I Iterative PKS n=1 Tax=Claviceps pusilla TaxID=123648 RepID=A0A9P7NGG3_9HYPO|nr:Type I Iterative PKS [Claviceps pusilla]
MDLQHHVLLFPGEYAELPEAMHDLAVRCRTNVQLQRLLADAASLIKQELAEAAFQYEHHPCEGGQGQAGGALDFEDVLELAEWHAEQQSPSLVIEMALLVTFQIAQALILAQVDASILSSENVIPVGFGPGLIAAAVVAASGSPNDITILGLHGLRVSMRLALALGQTGRNIEDTAGSWSRVVTGLAVQDVEARLAEANAGLHPLSQAYIGQCAPREEILIFGPPSTLHNLSAVASTTTTTVGSERPALTLTLPDSPACAPLYGPHLPPVDPSHIVDEDRSCLMSTSSLRKPLWSSHCASEPIPKNKSLADALCLVVAQIAHRRSRLDQTVEALVANFGHVKPDGVITTITLHVMGSERFASHARQQLEQGGHAVHLGPRLPLPKPFGDAGGDADGNRDDGVVSVSRHEIAVVGMAGRFPESDTLDEFWQLLESGQTTHREVPSSRFNVDDFYDPTRATHNALLARHGCFIKKPGHFDHRLFNISPREARQMDPVQRMLLMTTYEALEMAGYSPPGGSSNSGAAGAGSGSGRKPPRIATYFGQTVDDWKTINDQQGIDTHYLPAVNRSFAPGRIGHYFQWAGGFYSIDTGCSSSATALCLAREALASGECDAAVVGGGTLLAAPEWFAGLSQGGFLSPTGACKTYSDAADGYCRGEGVAVIVLKRVVDAVQSNDNILAVVSGAARNGNAGAGSITYPGEDAQAALYRRVLRQSGIQPHHVGVVEMHGTGTQAGDKVEMRAVQRVFAPSQTQTRQERQKRQKRRDPLIVGAVKAAVGHSEAAAGVVSLIKAILMLQRNTIPPQPGQPLTLNPNLVPLLGAEIQLANGQAWHRDGDDPRYILVNNFDAAGGNVSLILHDAPSFARKKAAGEHDHHHHQQQQQQQQQQQKHKHHIVVTSGRTASAHEANRKNLHRYLSENPETSLADLAYTTTARRMHQVHRDAYVVKSVADLRAQLQQPLPPTKFPAPASSVVFAFTGQGSQHVGMGSKLFCTSHKFRSLVESYQSLCDAQGLDCQLLSVIRGGSGDDTHAQFADKPATECDLQVATVALEIALAKYWQWLGLRPALLIGHSLGEYAALCVAGVLSVGHALALAYERATLISSRCAPGVCGMLAVGLPTSTVEQRLRDSTTTALADCEVTCFNGPSSTVVGGPLQALAAFETSLKSDAAGNNGTKISMTRLPVNHGFHTREMDAILDDLESAASRVVFHPPTLPMASTLLGRVVHPGQQGVFNANYVRRHSREPVSFMTAVRSCEAEGLIREDAFVVEIGPHPTCVALMTSCLPKDFKLNGFPSLRRGRGEDWLLISQCLAAAHCAQLPVSWDVFHGDHEKMDHPRLLGDLPTYAFDYKEFWHSYQTVTRKDAVASAADGGASQASSAAAAAAAAATAGRLSSTCLHSVRQLCREKHRISASFHVDLSDEHLSAAIGGHVVDGVAICPASIFVDMAYTAALFLVTESNGGSTKTSLTACELAQLAMLAPLALRKDVEPPLVEVEAVLDQPTNSVSVRFLSQARNGKGQATEHGSCTVHIVGQSSGCSLTRQWSRMRPLVKARVRSLHASLRPRDVHAMDKALFYKIFSEIVDYSRAFHAVEEATVASDFRDAAFKIQQQAAAMELGSYTSSPFTIDALVHVAGFLLNANVGKPKHEVHIANHIGSLRILGDLTTQGDGPLLAYASIREQDPASGTSLCDVYLTNSQDGLVAVCTDISFKKLDREFFALLTGSARAQPLPKPRQGAAAAAAAASSRTAGRKRDLTPSSTASDASVSESSSTSPSTLSGEKVRSGRARKQNQTKNKSRPTKSAPSACSQLLLLVAEALGLESQDLQPSTKFESIGMDSMLSIRITSSFQQEMGIELAAAFFSDYPTVAAAREALDGSPESAMSEKPSFDDPLMLRTWPRPSAASSEEEEGEEGEEEEEEKDEDGDEEEHVLTRQEMIDHAISRAVLIQGNARSREAPLFMTTDGSGTVESYIHLSALPNGRRIYALESPFVEDPEACDLSIQEMASIFVRAIRKIQPHGPYLIGGWSAGSINAYEVAYRLAMQGEDIAAFIILDMRPPSLIPTSIVTRDVVEKLGTFEGIKRARHLPEELSSRARTHLISTCVAMSQYDAPAFPAHRRPRHVAVVWARRGLDDRPDAPLAAMGRPGLDIGKTLDEMTLPEFEQYIQSWFYGRREQFGMNGWETLLGDHIAVHCVDGDHFSMMSPPFSAAVGAVVSDTVARAVSDE